MRRRPASSVPRSPGFQREFSIGQLRKEQSCRLPLIDHGRFEQRREQQAARPAL